MPRFSPPGPLGFGGAPLGNMFDVVDEETAEAALVAAWDSGVRYFDTAPHYGSGLSEHRFGTVLRRYPREAFVLSTKVGRLLRPDPSRPENPPFVEGLPFRVEPDYSYDATMRSIEDSYQRLGLAQIDIAFVHDLAADHLGDAWEDEFDVARTGAFRALTELREQGAIKGWGLGVNLTEPCIRALEQADPDLFLLAGRYSLLNQPALERLLARTSLWAGPIIPGCSPAGATSNTRKRRPKWSLSVIALSPSANATVSTSALQRSSSVRRIPWSRRSSRAPSGRRRWKRMRV